MAENKKIGITGRTKFFRRSDAMFCEDNWFMGKQQSPIETLGDLIDKTESFTRTYRLSDGQGNGLAIRMGNKELIIEKRR